MYSLLHECIFNPIPLKLSHFNFVLIIVHSI